MVPENTPSVKSSLDGEWDQIRSCPYCRWDTIRANYRWICEAGSIEIATSGNSTIDWLFGHVPLQHPIKLSVQSTESSPDTVSFNSVRSSDY